MKTAICTISSSSHLFKTNALFSSLLDKTNADLYCLLTDEKSAPDSTMSTSYLHLDQFTTEVAVKMKKKYKGDQLRWGFKPVLLSQLLNDGYEKVIYVDNDIFFISSPDFLFEKLQTNHILLTPHFYPSDPAKDQNWLEANFRVGLFNGGFFGVAKTALPALDWWAGCCLYNIKKSYRRGLFDDQKYLDLLPVLFDHVEILKHKGCNVAGWNLLTSQRSLDSNNEVILDEKWPLIFIHFNYYSIQMIMQGKDPVLKPYWDQYHQKLLQENPSYKFQKEIKSLSRDVRLYFDYIRYRTARLGE